MSFYREKVSQLLKHVLYGRRGEPYRVNGMELRYVIGSRPIRLKYRNSSNGVNANDAWQVDLLSKNLKEGSFCLDIGAHCGQYTILMAALCGHSGRVVAFEPDPHARKVLQRNIELNRKLKTPIIEEYACSDCLGNASFYSKQGNSQSSLARSAVEFDSTSVETLRVQTTTVDHYIKSKNFANAPDWVKIDAEGAEIRILKGAPELLSSHANIICELHPYAWMEFGNTYEELKSIVAKANRRMLLLSTRKEPPEKPEYSTVLLEKV